ncbi:MAG: thiazole synthase [Victivallaceae bacterium]
MKPLIIGGKTFKSRLFLGTGKFSSSNALNAAVIASETEMVTVALRRVNINDGSDDILGAIPKNVTVLLNTSGARNAADALKIARFGRAAGYEWIKLEIHPDPRYLLPDPIETYNAAMELVKDGFKVLPYINADPVLSKRLEDIGVHAVMPLGSPIGSNQGIQTEAMLRIIIEQANVPVIVDAGLGMPSHAAHAIELGADAVLINTAIAAAGDPAAMARAFAAAITAAETALDAVPAAKLDYASPTSPLNTFNDII